MIALRRIVYNRQFEQLLRTMFATQASYITGGKVCQNDSNLPTLQNPFASSIARHFSLTKSHQKYNKKDVESDSEDEEETEFKDERDSKVVKAKVNSLRADLILKAGLGMARK